MLPNWAARLLTDVWRRPSAHAAGIATVCVLAGLAVVALGARGKHADSRTPRRYSRTALVWSACCAADWALLTLLPVLRVSFAPHVLLPLLCCVAVRATLLVGLWVARLAARLRGKLPPARLRGDPVWLTFFALNLAFSGAQVDAYLVEPLWLKTTVISLDTDRWPQSDKPVRIVHLTDIHIERASYRERAMIRKVNALQADLIVLTGDYTNLSYLYEPTAIAQFREVIDQLRAPHGIYAVRGTVEPTLWSMEMLVQGTDIQWLEQEARALEIRGQRVDLVGVACSHDQELDEHRLEVTVADKDDALSLLLYHSPDLIERAADHGIDLYLAGHTHGGQLRLPILGAIVTGSAYGRQYVAGRFRVEHTTMVVSQGIGMEGGPMPRARFLCRPEIVVVDIHGTNH